MLAAGRDRGAVVGVALLIAGAAGSSNAWGHAHLTASRSSHRGREGPLVSLTREDRRVTRWLHARRFASSFPATRILASERLIGEQLPLPKTIEEFHLAFNRGVLSLPAPLFANGDHYVSMASALSEAAAYGLHRKTGVDPWRRPASDANHPFVTGALQDDQPHRIIEMVTKGIYPPMAAGPRRRKVNSLLHDHIVEDNVQKAILQPDYSPTVIVVGAEELASLRTATRKEGLLETPQDELIAVAAMARRKLNKMFSAIAMPGGFGIGDGVLLLTQPVVSFEGAPTCADLPTQPALQDEQRTACLVARLIRYKNLEGQPIQREQRVEVAEVKVADLIDGVHPGHIVQNNKLDDQAKADKLLVAGARRWFLVEQLAEHFDGLLRPRAVRWFLAMLQSGYSTEAARGLLGRQPLQRVEQAKNAMVKFNEEHATWLDGALDGYLTRLAGFERYLDRVLVPYPWSSTAHLRPLPVRD